MKEIFFFVGLGLGTLCICQRCHLIGFTITPRRSHRQQYINASCRLHRRSDVKSHGGVTDLVSQVTVGYLYFLGLWFKKFQACGEVENGAVNTGRPSRLHMGLIHTSSTGWGAPFFTTQGSFTPRCSEHWVALLLPSWAHSHLGTLINPSPCFTVVTLLAGLGDSATDPGHSNFTCIVSCFCHGNISFHLNKISSSLHFVFLFYLLPRHLSL